MRTAQGDRHLHSTPGSYLATLRLTTFEKQWSEIGEMRILGNEDMTMLLFLWILCLKINVFNLFPSGKDLKTGWSYDPMDKTLKNSWMCLPFYLNNMWYIWSPILQRRLCHVQIKTTHIALLRNQRLILVKKQINLELSNLLRIPYLDPENTFSLVFSTYLFILVKKKEKEHKIIKLLDITTKFFEKKRDGNRW